MQNVTASEQSQWNNWTHNSYKVLRSTEMIKTAAVYKYPFSFLQRDYHRLTGTTWLRTEHTVSKTADEPLTPSALPRLMSAWKPYRLTKEQNQTLFVFRCFIPSFYHCTRHVRVLSECTALKVTIGPENILFAGLSVRADLSARTDLNFQYGRAVSAAVTELEESVKWHKSHCP